MVTYTPEGTVNVFPSDEVVEEAIERLSSGTTHEPSATESIAPPLPPPPQHGQTCAAGDSTCASGTAGGTGAGESLKKMADMLSATAAMANVAGTHIVSPRSQWSLLVASVTALVVYVGTKVSFSRPSSHAREFALLSLNRCASFSRIPVSPHCFCRSTLACARHFVVRAAHAFLTHEAAGCSRRHASAGLDQGGGVCAQTRLAFSGTAAHAPRQHGLAQSEALCVMVALGHVAS